MPLRDCAYLLPAGRSVSRSSRIWPMNADSRVVAPLLMSLQSRSADKGRTYRDLSDRSVDYVELRES